MISEQSVALSPSRRAGASERERRGGGGGRGSSI